MIIYIGSIGCIYIFYFHFFSFILVVLVVFTYFISISCLTSVCPIIMYLDVDKSLARPGRIEARKYVRDARDFNNMEDRSVKFFIFLQVKAPKEIHPILTETLACLLPGWVKDLSAPPVRTANRRDGTHFCCLFFKALFVV